MKSLFILAVAVGTYALPQAGTLGIEDPKLAPSRAPQVQTSMPRPKIPVLQTTKPITKIPALQTTKPDSGVAALQTTVPDSEIAALQTTMPDSEEVAALQTTMPGSEEVAALQTTMPDPKVAALQTTTPASGVAALQTTVPTPATSTSASASAFAPAWWPSFGLPLPGAAPDAAAQDALTAKYACKAHADCAVRNAPNCCGFYPACVNKDAVMSQPACGGAAGVASVCGFPQLQSCSCSFGRCVGLPVGGSISL